MDAADCLRGLRNGTQALIPISILRGAAPLILIILHKYTPDGVDCSPGMSCMELA